MIAILALVMSGFLAQIVPTPGPVSGDIPYRLLGSDIPRQGDKLKQAGFVVSVERPLKRSEIEHLVCQVLAKEKPPGYDRLSISVYVDLDEYIPDIGSPILAQKNREHHLAWYVWRNGLSSARRLTITRDTKGRSISPPDLFDFDHAKACGPH